MATGEKIRNCLAMIFEFMKDGKVIVDMTSYIKKMEEEFPNKLKEGVKLPWTERLFKVDDDSPDLEEKKVKIMYTFYDEGKVCL